METSRITRLQQIFGAQEKFSIEDHKRIQHDVYSLEAERDLPGFKSWTANIPMSNGPEA